MLLYVIPKDALAARAQKIFHKIRNLTEKNLEKKNLNFV